MSDIDSLNGNNKVKVWKYQMFLGKFIGALPKFWVDNNYFCSAKIIVRAPNWQTELFLHHYHLHYHMCFVLNFEYYRYSSLYIRTVLIIAVTFKYFIADRIKDNSNITT